MAPAGANLINPEDRGIRQVRSKALASLLAGLLVLPAAILAAASPAEAASGIKLLISGDSITQGSSGDYTWRYRLSKKLASTAPGQVTLVGTRADLWNNVNNRPGSTYYADPSFAARAHCAAWGTTLIAEIPNIRSQVSMTGADTLLVMLGSNDLSYHSSPTAALQNLEAYLNQARAGNPGVDIVIGGVLTKYDIFGGSVLLAGQAAEFNAGAAVLAARLTTATSRIVVAPTASGWDPIVHTYDGTHPNPTGETIIAQRFSTGLSNLGIGTASPNIIATTPWAVPGPKPEVTPGSESASLTWQRVTTGSYGMFIEQRLTNNSGPWDRLPYPVAGDSFSPGLMAAGGTYGFRLVPSKGSPSGVGER